MTDARTTSLSPFLTIARLLRCSEGQAYTLVLGALIAVLLAALSYPQLGPTAGVAAGNATNRRASPTSSPPAPQPASAATRTPTPSVAYHAPEVTEPGIASEPSGAAASFQTLNVGTPGAPEGLAATSDGRVYVSTNNAAGRGDSNAEPRVLEFLSDGSPAREFVIPRGADGASEALGGVALDGDRLLVASASPPAVYQVDLTSGAISKLADIPDVPPCLPLSAAACEPRLVNHAPLPRAVATRAGSAFVTDAGQGVIWRIDSTGAVTEWFRDQSLAPLLFGDGGVTGIAVDAQGGILVTVPSSGPDGIGRLVRLEDDGTMSNLVTFPAGQNPFGVAVAGDGAIAVSLAGQGAVILLDHTGKTVSRQPGSGTLSEPTGVAFEDHDLLVALRSADKIDRLTR